jgi:hypothetical protein
VDDHAEVRAFTAAPTEETTRVAKFYDMTTGTLAGGFWNEQAAALIERGGAGSARDAAKIFATVNMAMMDGVVACHDSKYAYWVPRPSQADPALKTVIGVPNHPSYPSNHSCLSTAAGIVLGHFFPAERARMKKVSTEAGLSRIYAGLHYRFDVDAGNAIGQAIGNAAAREHDATLARISGSKVASR